MRTNLLNYFVIFTLIIAFINTNNIYSAEKIRVIDKYQDLPVAFANYIYDSQKGRTNKDGIFSIDYIAGATLELSHITLGKVIFSEIEIKQALNSKVLYVEPKSINFYPINVIALRPKIDELEIMELDYLDKMAHDGGQVLSRNIAVSGIRKSGSYGFDPVIRGFKYEQLNIVMNGALSPIAACPNRMDPPTSQMSPNMIESIEIIKGPYSLRYGSGFGGTINYKSAPAQFNDIKTTYGRASSIYESNGGIFRGEGLFGFSGNNHDIGFFASWSQGNDYTAGNDIVIPANFSRSSFGSDMNFKFNNNTVGLKIIGNIASDADFPALPMDLRNDNTWMISASHNIKFISNRYKSLNSVLYFSHVDHFMDNRLKLIEPRILNAETSAITFTYGGRSELEWTLFSGSLFSGIDLKIENAEGIRTREFIAGPNAGKIFRDNAWQNSQISKTSIFTEYRNMINQYKIIISGRLEYNQGQISNPDEEFSLLYSDTKVSQINPSISFGAINNLTNNMSLGLWLGRATRSGSISERYINYFPIGKDPYEMLGNPELNPEINNQIDLTYEYRINSLYFNFDVFASYIQNYISSVIDPILKPRLPASPGVRQYINIDEAFKTGFEFEFSSKLFIGVHQHFSLSYTYAESITGNHPLPEIAPLSVRYKLYGSYLNNRLRPSLSVRHSSRQNRISKEYGETLTPDFTVFDAEINYSIFKTINLAVGVQNILDRAYYEHLSRFINSATPYPIYSTGRNAYISINLTY
jgi:iron complex outermembrane recepter protein